VEGLALLRTHRPYLQLMRGVALFCVTSLMYTAIARVPLADATAGLFFSPIIVTLLSAAFLGVRIGLHRMLAILAGFAGGERTLHLVARTRGIAQASERSALR
jgi:drug/metabolite transporter (DMT)-like permease